MCFVSRECINLFTAIFFSKCINPFQREQTDSVLLITCLLRLVRRLSACKPFNHTSGVTVVTPTGRPKSVRNRCVIEVLVTFYVLSRCFLDFSLGVRAFVIGPSSDLFLFL